MDFKELFKSKGIGYWICTGASVLSLILAIIVFATSGTALPGVHTDGYIIGIVLLLPIIVQAAVTFFPLRFSPLLLVAIFGLAVGTVILRIPEAIVDYINQVAYQGGNFGLCVFYLVSVLLLAAACIVGCFFDQTKEDKYII